VTENNTTALELYQRRGLIATEDTQFLRKDSSLTVRKMRATLPDHA